METMHAAGRRRLPPVPRSAGSRPGGGQLTAERPLPEPIEAERSETQVIDTRQIEADLIEAELSEAELAALTADDPVDVAGTAEDAPVTGDTDQSPPAEIAAEAAAATVESDPVAEDIAADEPQPEPQPEPRPEPPADVPVDEQDPAQQFVARLRSAAADFAGAAGAESAVVREAVPPARHRRARCRLVLRYEDGDVADVTLLGSVGVPGRPSRHGFDRQILRWLGAGLVRDDAWLVDDPDAPDGVAVDLSAWVAAG
jgi:hypothetical protein